MLETHTMDKTPTRDETPVSGSAAPQPAWRAVGCLSATAESFQPDLPQTALSLQQRVTDIGMARFLSGLNNGVLAFSIEGPVSPAHVEATVEALVRRHGVLRTRYDDARHPDAGSILARASASIERIAIDDELDAERIDAILADAAPWAFADLDLVSEHVLRCRLYHGDARSVVVLVLPHFVCDALAMEILYRDWERFYRDPSINADEDLTVSNYDSYVRRQGAAMRESSWSDAIEEWKGIYSGETQLAIPAGYADPAAEPGYASLEVFTLDHERLDRLRALAQDARCSPDIGLYTVLGLGLGRWAGMDRFLLPTIYHGRDTRSALSTVGLFLVGTMLPIDCAPGLTFAEGLAATAGAWNRLGRHGGLPAFLALTELMSTQIASAAGRSLVANILANLNPAVRSANTIGSDQANDAEFRRLRLAPPPIGNPAGSAMFLLISGDSDSVTGTLAYDRTRIDAAGIDAMLASFRDTLAAI